MAIQSIGSIKMVLGLLGSASVAAVGGGYVIKDDQGKPIIQSLFSAPQAPVEQSPAAEPAPAEAVQQLAALPETEEPVAEPEATIAGPQLPTFDILRVEPDGSVVIAGQAPANSKVEILAKGEVLGSTTSGSGGDFAVVFDNPLEPGDYELFIRATPKDGGESADSVVSAEAAIVTIPEKDDAGGEALAMVQEQGEPTRILQKPESMTPEPAPVPEPVEMAADAGEEVSEPAPEIMISPVTVEAVDVEEDKLFIAGTGEAGSRVRIYINDVYRGMATVGPQGGFLFELNEGLARGSYDLRVDMMQPGSGDVASRVAVVVDHQPEPAQQVAAVEPEPEPETEVVEAEAAAPAVEPEEPETIKTGRSVIIRRGDNLWNISRRMLGQGQKYTLIFSANANQIQDPDRIFPGQVFDVPEEEPALEAGNQG